MTPSAPTRLVARLGTTQTLAWASSYYLPALLAQPLAADLGLPESQVFAAFTAALLVSALVGPRSGRAIDRLGGRHVLRGSSLLFAAGLVGLGLAQGAAHVWLAWAVLGLAMGSGLYDTAFATLVQHDAPRARNAITGITLMAGFASTVGWPLTAWGIDTLGWRGTCWGWAALHLLVGLPLHLGLPGRKAQSQAKTPSGTPPTAPLGPQPGRGDGCGDGGSAPAPRRLPAGPAVAIAAVFAITWFTSTAMAAHLPRLLEAQGLTTAAALGVAMLVGPAQVAGRLLEFGLLRRLHPLQSARLAAAAHPLGALVLVLLGPAGAVAFALMHGAGNGVLTVAKGTLPLAVFGPAGYGERLGWLMAPARVAQALAPVLFGLAWQQWGLGALGLTALLGTVALALLHRLVRLSPPHATAG